MGFEQRGGRSYYYRKVREGGRIRSIYVGGGLIGHLSAEEDNEERRERAAKRAAHLAARHVETEIDRQLAGAESALLALTHVTLFSVGYHQHKGQWRKKRHAE